MKDVKGENGAPAVMPSPELLWRAVEELRAVCRDAWQEGLLSGCNGNASLRLEASGACAGLLCMTRTGAAKGRLTPADLCLMDAATGACLANGPASSEAAVHLALYASQASCGAVLHTHPRRLLALSLVSRERGEGA
ncbi:MAG: class II aldolase/adducin family protein, partial [Desulfovibrio sp.]|nr:class II aldolase/adducin family protein [Desulfovibrio sp.]